MRTPSNPVPPRPRGESSVLPRRLLLAVPFLSVLAAATLAMSIALVFHPPSDSAFAEIRDLSGDSAFPQPPAAFFLVTGVLCATFAFIWPLLAGAFSDRRRRMLLMGIVTIAALSPLIIAGVGFVQHGKDAVFLLALIFYGELIIYSAPLPFVVTGVTRRRQEFAVTGIVLITGSIFAGLNDPELDFNLMDPSVAEMLLIYIFGFALLVFIEGAYLSIRLSTYLETIYSGGTGVSAELNIGRIIRTFLMHGVIITGTALAGGFFALNYEESVLEFLPGVMSSSRELVGVYGKVIFSTLFLLMLVVVRLVLPDLSRHVGLRAASRKGEDEDEDAGEQTDLSVYTKNPDATDPGKGAAE